MTRKTMLVVVATIILTATVSSALTDTPSKPEQLPAIGPGALTVPVRITNFPNPQQVAGTMNVGNLPAVQSVSGTVNVGNLPATQSITGQVDVANLPIDDQGNLRTSSAHRSSRRVVELVNADIPMTLVHDPDGNYTCQEWMSAPFDATDYTLLAAYAVDVPGSYGGAPNGIGVTCAFLWSWPEDPAGRVFMATKQGQQATISMEDDPSNRPSLAFRSVVGAVGYVRCFCGWVPAGAGGYVSPILRQVSIFLTNE